MKILRNHFQILCFLFFSFSYLAVINLYLLYRDSDTVVFVPGTLLAGLAGYWIGGYLYDQYSNN